MFKIVMSSWGGTRRDMFTDLTYEEAYAICESYGWQASPDGGYVWDLEIEEHPQIIKNCPDESLKIKTKRREASATN